MRSKFLTNMLSKLFKTTGSQILEKNPIFFLHLENTSTGAQYFIQEYNTHTKCFYGLTVLGTDPKLAKWEYTHTLGLETNPNIIQDQLWTSITLSELKAKFKLIIL